MGHSFHSFSRSHGTAMSSLKLPFRYSRRPDGWINTTLIARAAAFDSTRTYVQTSIVNSEKEAAVTAVVLTEKEKKQAAAEYQKRRSVYRQQVSQLRKQYAVEVARQRAIDEAEEKARLAAIRRAALERKRLKNIRTAQNALRQKELREQRHREWEEELRVAQVNRDARNGRFNKARQLVIDEMEAQAHLWLTTPEEVIASFTHEASNLLWARPGGVIGAPTPTADSEYWRLECHTWHMEQTYPERKELLFKEIMEEIYEQANVDTAIWTPERVAQREVLEKKAKLRAMVRLRGLALLLEKRRQIFVEYYLPKYGDIPKEAPIPDLRVFTHRVAMEREGVRDLFENPTAYFHFANDMASETQSTEPGQDGSTVQKSSYSGPTLGEPIALKDWIRDDTPGGTPYPVIVGQMPKVTAKSERERKRMEREIKMRAAAEAKMTERERQDAEIQAELDDDDDSDEEYDPAAFAGEPELDEDDLEWIASLDPVEDADLLKMPPHMRYTEEDILWVLEKLRQESKNMDLLIKQGEDGIRQLEKAAEAERAFIPSGDDALSKIGIDPARVQKLLSSLTNEQTKTLLGMGLREDMSDDEIREAYKNVSFLTDEQRSELIEFDLLYLQSKRNSSNG